MKFITACLVLIMGLFMISCERSPATARAGSESDQTFARERRAYEDRVAARLKEFDHRFDGLDARLEGLPRADQDHLRVDIQELRDRREALGQKLNDLHKVSDQSWQDVRGSLDRDLDQLEVAYNLVSANNNGHKGP